MAILSDLRKKSRKVNDNTIAAEGLRIFSANFEGTSVEADEKLAIILLKSLGRALEVETKTGTATATEYPKSALSTISDVLEFIILIEVYI